MIQDSSSGTAIEWIEDIRAESAKREVDRFNPFLNPGQTHKAVAAIDVAGFVEHAAVIGVERNRTRSAKLEFELLQLLLNSQQAHKAVAVIGFSALSACGRIVGVGILDRLDGVQHTGQGGGSYFGFLALRAGCGGQFLCHGDSLVRVDFQPAAVFELQFHSPVR